MNWLMQAQGPLPQLVAWGIPYQRGEPDRTGELWYCGTCGYVYAKILCKSAAGAECPVLAYRGCCENCAQPYHGAVPGSIWTSWDHPRTASLPQALLEREFELHYTQAQKEGHI
jgi:hypothetical protein